MRLRSNTIRSREAIPVRYTCDGENLSPPLEWDGVPEEAESLVLIVDDPDAAGEKAWSHWVLYDVPADVQDLPENFHPKQRGYAGIEGRNDFGESGWGGPCPPPRDEAHTYFFRLYALDELLDLPPGANRDQVLDAMRGHILDQTELMATYTRQT